ncbi:competence/damage-inducible protein A [Paenibacillus sp. WLX1005]|uniref:competence/damage-inducible protein A n=1 Tax=Paenibacillus sp. WLX1005 TaxID=3243766 RepID=UPI003983FE95
MKAVKAEIIAVGTELLLGQITNTNAQYLSQQLSYLGIDVYYQTVVGDNLNRLKQAIELASSRADVVVFSGGIGPTQDDLTKDALGEVLGRSLHIYPEAMQKIETFFEGRDKPMTENNRRQAIILEHSHPLDNEVGLAVGIAISQNDKHYVVLPGPPKELKPMFEQQAVPWLLSNVLSGEYPIYSKMLKFAGIGESALEDALLDLISAQTDPTIAPYAKEAEVTIRLTTKAPDEKQAMEKLKAMEAVIRDRLPDHMYADQDIRIEQQILQMMTGMKLTLAAAESCTGGLIMENLTKVPGSALVFMGGIVSYSNEMKEKLLQIPHDLLEGEDAPGAVSEEVAELMAHEARKILDTDFAVAVTGVAGPGSSERKPVGLVYIALAERGRDTAVWKLNLKGNREAIRIRSAKSIMYRLWLRLKQLQHEQPGITEHKG